MIGTLGSKHMLGSRSLEHTVLNLCVRKSAPTLARVVRTQICQQLVVDGSGAENSGTHRARRVSRALELAQFQKRATIHVVADTALRRKKKTGRQDAWQQRYVAPHFRSCFLRNCLTTTSARLDCWSKNQCDCHPFWGTSAPTVPRQTIPKLPSNKSNAIQYSRCSGASGFRRGSKRDEQCSHTSTKQGERYKRKG